MTSKSKSAKAGRARSSDTAKRRRISRWAVVKLDDFNNILEIEHLTEDYKEALVEWRGRKTYVVLKLRLDYTP